VTVRTGKTCAETGAKVLGLFGTSEELDNLIFNCDRLALRF
jgi:hypothetical protein